MTVAVREYLSGTNRTTSKVRSSVAIGVNQTWRGSPILVANDPSRTLAASSSGLIATHFSLAGPLGFSITRRITLTRAYGATEIITLLGGAGGGMAAEGACATAREDGAHRRYLWTVSENDPERTGAPRLPCGRRLNQPAGGRKESAIDYACGRRY